MPGAAADVGRRDTGGEAGRCSYVKSRLSKDQVLPSPGGQVCQDEGALHPVDLPVGYHTVLRAQSWTSSAGGGRRGLRPERRAVGRCQVNGMKLGSGRVRVQAATARESVDSTVCRRR